MGVLSVTIILIDAAKINVHTYTRRRRTVSTGSGGISTVGASMPVSTTGMVQEVNIGIPSPVVVKDKGKGKMEESEDEQTKRTKLQQEQKRLSHEAVRLQEELDKEERQRMARVHEASQSFTEEEWENIRARVEADEELSKRLQAEERNKYKVRSSKRAVEAELDHEGSKRQKTNEASGSIQEQPEEEEKELDDLVMLWNLVKERFSSTEPTDDKERTLWVELKRLFKPNTNDTPMETSKPLLKDAEAEDVDVHLYRSMIGSLMYLTASRPDIMFVVCACARFQVTPKVSHLYAVKRIFRYLKGQPKLGLWYPKDSPFDLEAYTNSNYTGTSLDRRKSTTGAKKQYFQVQDYALWDVIENGNSFKPTAQTTTNADGSSNTLIPGLVTADEKTQKKNDLKSISIFGGNDATKKTQKTLLKQMYENFSAPSTESLDSIFNRLQKIVSQLAFLGENIIQEDLNLKFLRSLPSEWNAHVMV
ncbi:hypothetical protein Tco_1289829 [Tanacetum coccineum]